MVAASRRVVWGTLFGGGLGALAALLLALGIWGYQIIAVDCTPVDRARDLERLSSFLPKALIAGSSVGVAGGLVGSIYKISIPLAIAWIGLGACVGRIISLSHTQAKETNDVSLGPTIVAGIVAAVILTAYGIWHSRRCPR